MIGQISYNTILLLLLLLLKTNYAEYIMLFRHKFEQINHISVIKLKKDHEISKSTFINNIS